MQFNREKFEQLKYLGMRGAARAKPLSAVIEVAYAIRPEEGKPDFEFGWSGFNRLGVNAEVLESIKSLNYSEQLAVSGGYIALGPACFSGWDLKNIQKLSIKDRAAIGNLIEEIFKTYLDFEGDPILNLDVESMQIEAEVVVYGFELYAPVSMETWKKLYTLHSLEITAANLLLQRWSEDVSTERTLN